MPTDVEKQAQEIAALTTGAPARRIRGAGGTPGGVGTFLIGLAMVVCGGWLVLNQVQVTSSYSFFGLWGWSRPGGFGLTLLPMLVGIGALFFDGKSKIGWGLSIGGLLVVLLSVLMSLSIHWQQTSLLNTILMFGILAGGLGLVFRSLRAYPVDEAEAG